MSNQEDLFEHRYPAFFTATILDWKKLLAPDKYKDLIVNSLRFLVEQKRIELYGFVIMPNHIHVLWLILPPHKREAIQRDFLKFTAQKIKKDLKENHLQVLTHFKVGGSDRKYQFWQRNPLSIYCYSDQMIEQKLTYIHDNPTQDKWQLVSLPEQYIYSSAKFYIENQDEFGFITHYMNN